MNLVSSWMCGYGYWLPGVDSNHDQKNQNLLCYRCTTG